MEDLTLWIYRQAAIAIFPQSLLCLFNPKILYALLDHPGMDFGIAYWAMKTGMVVNVEISNFYVR